MVDHLIELMEHVVTEVDLGGQRRAENKCTTATTVPGFDREVGREVVPTARPGRIVSKATDLATEPVTRWSGP